MGFWAAVDTGARSVTTAEATFRFCQERFRAILLDFNFWSFQTKAACRELIFIDVGIDRINKSQADNDHNNVTRGSLCQDTAQCNH